MSVACRSRRPSASLDLSPPSANTGAQPIQLPYDVLALVVCAVRLPTSLKTLCLASYALLRLAGRALCTHVAVRPTHLSLFWKHLVRPLPRTLCLLGNPL